MLVIVRCWSLGAFHFAEGFVCEVRFKHRRRLRTRVVWSRGCPLCRRDHPAVPAQSQVSGRYIGTSSDVRPEHHPHRHGNSHCSRTGLYPKYRGPCVLVPPMLVLSNPEHPVCRSRKYGSTLMAFINHAASTVSHQLALVTLGFALCPLPFAPCPSPVSCGILAWPQAGVARYSGWPTLRESRRLSPGFSVSSRSPVS